jgi:hypothetical protein
MVSVLQNIHGGFHLKTSSVIRVSLTLTFILSAVNLETLAILENFFKFLKKNFLILWKVHKLKFVGEPPLPIPPSAAGRRGRRPLHFLYKILWQFKIINGSQSLYYTGLGA